MLAVSTAASIGLPGCGADVAGRPGIVRSPPHRFVAPGGDDRGAGRASAPWRTLQHAVAAAPDGAVVTVRSGRYAGFRARGARGLSITGDPRGPRPRVVGPPPGDGGGDTITLHDARGVRLARMVVSGAREAYDAGVHVTRSRGVRLERLLLEHNHSFGAEIADSTDVSVRRSVMTRNDTGLQVTRSRRVRIEHNDLVRNDSMIVDDPAPDNDRGANAIVVYQSPGPVRIAANRAWGNRARSTDFGFDGGAFEIYGSSRVQIVGNRVWDNQNVVETGTSPGGGCRDNRFEGNVAFAGGADGPTLGMILRCAAGMQIVDNTFYDLDRFTFDVTADARSFGGSVDGLTILGNRAVSHGDKVYSIDSALPSTVRIDGQLAFNAAGGPLAYVQGRGQTRSLVTFRDWTGFEAAGLQRAPRFRDPARADFRRAPGSVWTTGPRAAP